MWMVFSHFAMMDDLLYALISDRARKHGLTCMNTIDKISKLHPRSLSVSFLVLYYRTQQYHRGEVFTCIIIMYSKAGISQSFHIEKTAATESLMYLQMGYS